MMMIIIIITTTTTITTIRHWPRGTLYPQNVGTNFADKRRSLGGYSSLADSGHGAAAAATTT
jgi:hypothetical protein